jgi:hypothetical protein
VGRKGHPAFSDLQVTQINEKGIRRRMSLCPACRRPKFISKDEVFHMLTYEDCVGLCELTSEEVDAIAEHEHIPSIVAAELGNYLVHDEQSGVPKIRRIILDDIKAAEQRGDKKHLLVLKLTLKHFVDTHPTACASPA